MRRTTLATTPSRQWVVGVGVFAQGDAMEHTGDPAGARRDVGVRSSVGQRAARRVSVRLRRRQLAAGSSPTRLSFSLYTRHQHVSPLSAMTFVSRRKAGVTLSRTSNELTSKLSQRSQSQPQSQRRRFTCAQKLTYS